MYGRNGPAVPGWSLEAMVPEFTRHATELIQRTRFAMGTHNGDRCSFTPR